MSQSNSESVSLNTWRNRTLKLALMRSSKFTNKMQLVQHATGSSGVGRLERCQHAAGKMDQRLRMGRSLGTPSWLWRAYPSITKRPSAAIRDPQ